MKQPLKILILLTIFQTFFINYARADRQCRIAIMPNCSQKLADKVDYGRNSNLRGVFLTELKIQKEALFNRSSITIGYFDSNDLDAGKSQCKEPGQKHPVLIGTNLAQIGLEVDYLLIFEPTSSGVSNFKLVDIRHLSGKQRISFNILPASEGGTNPNVIATGIAAESDLGTLGQIIDVIDDCNTSNGVLAGRFMAPQTTPDKSIAALPKPANSDLERFCNTLTSKKDKQKCLELNSQQSKVPGNKI